MRKWWPIGVLLFVLIGDITIKKIEDSKVEELIAEQIERCQNLKKDNSKISMMLEEILNRLNKEQKLYQEVKKFRALAQKAADLISENEKLINNIPNEKDIKVVKNNVSQVRENFDKIFLIHRLILNVFAPLFEMEPPRQEILVYLPQPAGELDKLQRDFYLPK